MFACFLGAKKSFDTVRRDCLWYKLMSLGIRGKILRAVQSLSTELECVVKVNDYAAPFFDASHVVKQGCKLYPTLFSFYINDLANDI